MSISNKVVIVTGASSGIGANLAVEALKEGAKVTAVGRNKAKLDQTVKECEKVTGRKPLVVIADVSKEDQAADIINQTLKEYGKIDVLVNNAGFARHATIVANDALAAYDSVMRTNVRAVIHLTQLAIPHLIKTRGNIVNISSVASSKVIMEDMWAYCTSKAALDHFSRCMAVYLAPKGVRVNVVNPGPVETDFMENMGLNASEIEARMAMARSITLLKRFSRAIEVSDLVMFLASDKAVGITGSNFNVDNGVSLS